MNIKEYVESLKKFVEEKNISIFDYYYLYVETIKSNEKFELPDFELKNPFLKPSDIQKLLLCKEERIAEYFAYVMSKIIEFNEVLSKSEIKEVLDGMFAEETLSRKSIEEALLELYNDCEKKDNVDKTPIKILDEPDEMPSREDISEYIMEFLKPKSKVAITSINKDMANHLDGFVVIREEKTGVINLYHNDSKKNELTGRQVYSNNQLTVDNGYYVNIEEYVERLLDIIMSVYPSMEELSFYKDGEVKQLNEVLEEVFKVLRDNKLIRFGKDLKGIEIDTYKDLCNIPTKKEDYQGKLMQTGMYVRRDIITELFDQYKLRIIYNEEYKKNVSK